MQTNNNVSIVEQGRNQLAQALLQNSDLVQTLPVEQQDKFKQNFLDMATQDYLIQTIDPREIIRFTISLTRAGLSINPADKEVYVVPFNTEVRKQKVMLPQAIIPLNGIQEQAFQKGFFLRLYAVYKLGDEYASESNMTRQQQSMLNTTNPQWVNENFVGYDVVLVDLQKEIPDQTKFVEILYMKEVTKTIKDIRFQLQTWRHKAVRRAFGDFFMPKGRKIEIFDAIENINDNVLKDNSASTDVDSIDAIKCFEELQSGLAPLGVTLRFQNGMAFADGNTYGNAKTLQSLGFKVVDGSYVCASSAPALKPPLEEDTDVSSETNELGSLGLTIQVVKQKDLKYEVIVGNTEGCEDILEKYGFSKGTTGKWGRVANPFND